MVMEEKGKDLLIVYLDECLPTYVCTAHTCSTYHGQRKISDPLGYVYWDLKSGSLLEHKVLFPATPFFPVPATVILIHYAYERIYSDVILNTRKFMIKLESEVNNH